MNKLKTWSNNVSGILGFLVPFSFGVWLLQQSDSQSMNVTTWILWTIMDGVLVALSIRAGNKKPYLFIGWTLAALLVTTGMILKGAIWQIGFVEIVSLVGVIIATYFWVTNKSERGLYASAIAMFIAGVPQIVTFWTSPAIDTWWLWAGTALACTFSIIASPRLQNATNAPTMASFSYQIVVLAVLFL